MTSIQRGSPFILTGAWNWNASDSTLNRSPANASGSPSKNDGGAAADDAVERGDPLLTVEEELLGTGGRRATAHGLSAALGLPDEQGTDGEAVVQRLHQSADLVAVPDVAALELG